MDNCRSGDSRLRSSGVGARSGGGGPRSSGVGPRLGENDCRQSAVRLFPGKAKQKLAGVIHSAAAVSHSEAKSTHSGIIREMFART
jgi:hypothetical protein